MMTSSQIAQANQNAFSMGFGANAGIGGYESMTGFTPFGHGSGSQFGTSALTGANAAVGTASTLGMLAHFGGMGVNKLFAGSRVGAALSGIGAATGMALPAAATFGLMMPAQLALSGMASGAQQVAQTQNVMDNTFGSRVNMGGRFGFGVSRQDALNMTEAIRSLKSVPEMMTSMGELQGVLGKISSMGMLQGVQSAAEFKTKFTSMVGALREISKNLGSTLDEALPFLQSSVRQGFLDAGEIQRNVQLGASASSVGIGMSRQRMFGLQEQGAGMIRQMGGDSRIGGMGARDVATSVSVAQSMGLLSQQDITRITGKVGEAGVEDLSKRFMSAQARMFQSTGAGRFFTAALAERDEAGNFTGRLNEGMLRKLRNNQIGGAELMRMGHRNLSGMSDEQAISFENAMARGMGAEAGALAGMSGGATAMNAVLEEMGADNDQAKRRILQSITNMSQAEADTMLELARNASNIQRRRNAEMVQAAVRDRSVAHFKENMTVSGMLHHATTRTQRALIDPFTSYGANVATRISERFDDVMDRFITGSSGQKANMLLNPLELARNVGGTLFGETSYRPNQNRLRGGLARLMAGGGTSMGDLGGMDLTSGLMEEGLGLSDIGTSATNAAGVTGLRFGVNFAGLGLQAVGASGIGSALLGLGTGPLGTLALGGMAVSGLVNAYSGLDEDEARNIFGGARTGGALSKMFKRKVGQADARNAARRLSSIMREQGISAGDLSRTSLDDMLEIAQSLGEGGGRSGLEIIAAAAQSQGMGGLEGELGTELRDRISSGLLAKAIQGEGALGSVAEANKRLEDIFDPGAGDRFFGDILDTEYGTGDASSRVYFASSAAKSLFEGSDDQRKGLLKILGDKKIRGALANFSGRKGSIERLAKRFGLEGMGIDNLMALSKDISSAYAQDSDAEQYFDLLSKEMINADAVLQGEDDRLARQSMLQTFTQGFSDKALGKNIFDLALSGKGALGNVGEISKLLQGDVKGRVAKMLKTALASDNLVGVKDQKGALGKLKSLGFSDAQIKAAGIFDDDAALSDSERSRVSQIIGVGGVLESELKVGSSRMTQRANAMGVDVEGIRDKAFKESLEAQATTLRAHTEFVRTVGDVVPRLRKAADETTVVNTRK